MTLQDFLDAYDATRAQSISERFDAYTAHLIETNEKFNLTAITDPAEISELHYLDSAQGARLLPRGAKVCDVGAGAGFPSVPLALLRDDCTFTLVDSLNKRVGFLQEIFRRLDLPHCRAVHSRAEDFARTHRGAFDVVVARAVAPLPTLLEYCAPLTAQGGLVVAYKGNRADEEAEDAQRAATQLGLLAIDAIAYTLPIGGTRKILVYRRDGDCPTRYPRGGNKPRTNPL